MDAYRERHHIKPRALGGSDLPENLVDLTYREHFLVHWLLTRICVGRERQSMVFALTAMTMQRGRRLIAGWQVEMAKRVLKDAALARLKRRKAIAEADRKARLRLEHEAAAVLEKLQAQTGPNAFNSNELSQAGSSFVRQERQRIAALPKRKFRPRRRKRLPGEVIRKTG